MGYSVLLPLCRSLPACSRSNDRERKTVVQDRDRQVKNVQELEAELHRSELSESNLRNEVQQRQHLEENITHHRKDIASSTAELKVSMGSCTSYNTLQLGNRTRT
jgi:septal ring factor EnvC (AmiA/AmiB activator)